jgi:hypothetical protein
VNRRLDYVYRLIDQDQLPIPLSGWYSPVIGTPATMEDPSSPLKSLMSESTNAGVGRINHFSLSGFGYYNQDPAVGSRKIQLVGYGANQDRRAI